MWVTKVAYRALKITSDDINLPVDSGDFKLLSRRAVNELLKLKEKDPFLRGLVAWVGFKQVQVFYEREKRFAGKTKFPLRGLNPIKAFIAGLTSFSTMPLAVALLVGLIVSAGALFFLFVIVIYKFLGNPISGWSAIMAAILFLGGIQLLTTGILGLYIGRIYSETKNRPTYIVDNTIGIEEGK
jgi:dolichol-phosphate mannosyltransferase